MMTSSESIPSESSAPDAPDAPENSPKHESMSGSFQEYIAKLNQLPTPEEKIALGLEFMRASISQEGTPRFREFWEARRDLLPLFKQNLGPAIRSKLWNEYVELTIEARRLKEILEEQSSFAIEQIDLAISALEQDIEHFQKLLEQAPPIEFPAEALSIQENADSYNQIQRELNLLNNLASRLNGLRKEIIKTEMRIRFKTKFFKRLSELGDHIFPRRKELIEQIGAQFEKDIDRFVEQHFQGSDVVGAPYYALREEIKALQGLAKLITLNTNVFTKTRLKLSECWDKIKVLEKAHKQEFQQKKQVWTDNRAILDAKIEELKKQIEGMDLKQLDAAIDEIQNQMRPMELGKEDVRHIRQELYQLRAPFLAIEEQKRKELEQAERDKLQLRKDKVSSLKERLIVLQKDAEKSADELSYEFDQIRREIEELSLSKYDLQQFERLMRPAKDLIAERKESALLNLSDDERNALEQLREILEQRKLRRQEIKDQLEIYRKMLGGSSLDFEKAMSVREQIDLEKERLEKANASISEIEQKISAIEENA
jgi:DNA repair exonuclease SbcCD ATPase subunit